jgi:hypothetical protein
MSDPIEDELRRALKTVDPPEGFADRVMARIPERRPRPAQRLWYGAIAAGLALLLALGGFEHNKKQQQTRAEQTGRQVIFALALVADKLDRVNERLQKSAPDLKATPDLAVDKDKGQHL